METKIQLVTLKNIYFCFYTKIACKLSILTFLVDAPATATNCVDIGNFALRLKRIICNVNVCVTSMSSCCLIDLNDLIIIHCNYSKVATDNYHAYTNCKLIISFIASADKFI